MDILRYEQCLAGLHLSARPVIFLAGPTVRGNQPHLTSWRFAAIDAFQSQNFDGTLIIPEFSSPRELENDTRWIPKWEFAGLYACDVILFWIPRTRELLGMTTNHEHGYWLARMPDKVVYGRPDDSYRNSYLDQMWHLQAEQRGVSLPPIFSTLEETVKPSMAIASQSARRWRSQSKVPVDSPFGAFVV